MPAHEFGIMGRSPGRERYDAYEPEKYCCIRVDDRWIGPLLPQLEAVKCFWHTRACPAQGLAYCGVTLIPPESAPAFCAVLRQAGNRQLKPLIRLLEDAAARGNFVIHFGI